MSNAVQIIEPLLEQPRTSDELCRLTGYSAGTIGVALAQLRQRGRLVELARVNRGFGGGSGRGYGVFQLKAAE